MTSLTFLYIKHVDSMSLRFCEARFSPISHVSSTLPCIYFCIRGRSAGSFPKQRLVIEPMHLSGNRSQKTSKCGKNISDPQISPCVPLFCPYHILMSSVNYFRTDIPQQLTWNLLVNFTITAEILAHSLANF